MSEIKTVSVIGMGYIGLPTCAIFASRGLDVIGIDVNPKVVDKVNRGEIHIVEPDLDGLIHKVVSTGKLRATTTPVPADAFVIAVPTPMSEDHAPDVSYVMAATRSVAPVLKAGDLVVLESTSPVGTTRKMAALLAELRPDLRFPHEGSEDADVFVAYSPERVLPGKVLTELINNDRSIGGLNRKSSEVAVKLYSSFVDGDLFITSAESAELVKLSENAFRDVNIAFANELAAVCQELSLNVWEVIELANRHPRVNILQPGPGVGGHCIAIDPYFIIDAAPASTLLMGSARKVNSGRPQAVVDDVKALLQPDKLQTVACLGLSFKPNIDDVRESPAVEVVKLLSEVPGLRLIAAEPNIDALPAELQGTKVTFTDALTAIDRADIVLLLVDHRQFGLIDPRAFDNKKLIDTRGLWTWRKAQRPDARIEGQRSREDRLRGHPLRRSSDFAGGMTMQGWSQHPLLAERRLEFLGAPMHALTMDETLALAGEAMARRLPLHHTVVNVAKLVTMKKNAELREDVTSADLINIDGAGVLWGARLCGIEVPERVAGVDIMINLFALCARQGYRPYLLGAEKSVLQAVDMRLARDYPELVVAGMRDGYFSVEDEAEVVAAINASRADCLFVAMPTPRKERFLKQYRDRLSPSFVMGVGGSFDVYGGKVARAPKLVQKLGLEWLFRVLQEPRRLWRRYFETNTAYAGLLWREFWGRRHSA